MLQTIRQGMQKKQSAVFAGLALVCYLFTAAMVPAGHMAAPLGSGTAFHLCPGDARSSLIIDALASVSSGSDHHQRSHQHHSDHTPTDSAPAHGGSDGHGNNASETSAEPGCIFAGASIAFAADSSNGSDTLAPGGPVFQPAPRRFYQSTSWLRPPVRSPPV